MLRSRLVVSCHPAYRTPALPARLETDASSCFSLMSEISSRLVMRLRIRNASLGREHIGAKLQNLMYWPCRGSTPRGLRTVVYGLNHGLRAYRCPSTNLFMSINEGQYAVQLGLCTG